MPEQTPVEAFQVPPAQEKIATVSALVVLGETPSVIRFAVPVEVIASPSPCASNVPLFVRFTYLLTTSPGARLEIEVVNPTPLSDFPNTNVPEVLV